MRNKNKYICPYCIEEHVLQDVEFRCKNDLCSEKIRDKAYAKYMGVPTESLPFQNVAFYTPDDKKFHFLKKHSMPKEAVCPFCGMKTETRICPECHQKLPDAVSDDDTVIIAVLGSFDSGISTYLSVLIHELEYSMIPYLTNGTIFPADDKVYNYYYRCYFEPNYIKHDKIRHYGLYCSQEEYLQPLIYELHFPLDKRGRRIRKIMLVFQENKDDGWGRTISETEMKRRNRYVAKVDGIIFLADPFQIPEIRVRMKDVEFAGSSCIDESYMYMHPIEMHIARIADILRVEYGLKKSGKVDIPIAVVLSKFDVLRRFFRKGSQVLKQSGYLETGHFDASEWIAVSDELTAMFKKWNMSSFMMNVYWHFNRYIFSAASSLGHPLAVPAYNGDCYRNREKLLVPQPHRIADAFFWILKEKGILK